MHTDPIADLLTRIRNASKAQHQVLTVAHSTIKENMLKIMKDRNFIQDYKSENEGIHKMLTITLNDSTQNLTFKRISKPGQRIYIKSQTLKPIKSNLGIAIISTSKGLMTNSDARKQRLGGELICEIF